MSEEDASEQERIQERKLLPSEFMRWRRPEYYSDSKDQSAYELDPKLLEFTLESLTARNEHHDFEIFCRKLCERAICPHLRPATGPEGGGDGKVDTETYAVSDGVSALLYYGVPKASDERWAFAFSTKEKWAPKVRKDVEAIVSTGRNYARVICVTSRAAASRRRLQLEDELTREFGIPVTIHDRSWIVAEVIDKRRIDLAHNYLSVGQVVEVPALGPTDYARSQQLKDLEASIEDPTEFEGLEAQRATEALVAAKLSRNLERPRHETEGRFQRAVRLADQDGTYYQKLRSRYEAIWTAIWWFDDFNFLIANYERFADLALESTDVRDLELLANVIQLFVNGQIHGHLTPTEARIEERYQPLVKALSEIAANPERPNGALEAQLKLILIEMNEFAVQGRFNELPRFWERLREIIERAKPLGEFDFDQLEQLVDVFGLSAPNDAEFNRLVEDLAETVQARKGEAEGGLLLLRRAKQLNLEQKFEMIRLFGKAARSLAKKEYADSLIEALQHLAIAYQSAGLPWAARASCIFASAVIVIEDEDLTQLRAGMIPTVKMWAWIALDLWHVPDLLFCVLLLNGMRETLPLADETKKLVNRDVSELDTALMARLLLISDQELAEIGHLPDILEGLSLPMSRLGLLYRLGYEGLLRQEGSLPESDAPEKVNELMSGVANLAEGQLRSRPTVNNSKGRTNLFRSHVVGMDVDIICAGQENLLLVAEMLAASLEVFFATAIEHKLGAHTEKVKLVVASTPGLNPSFDFDLDSMSGTVLWPTGKRPCDFSGSEMASRLQYEVCAGVVAAACLAKDMKSTLSALFEDDLVADRLSMIGHTGNSYHRLARRYVSSIDDWSDYDPTTYELVKDRPAIAKSAGAPSRSDGPKEVSEQPPAPRSHDDFDVQSVIDLHLWDRARWRANFYVGVQPPSPRRPPALCLCFEDGEAGQKIFQRWRSRFGPVDEEEKIYVAIIRGVSGDNPHHYKVMITSAPSKDCGYRAGTFQIIPARINEMTPNTSENLERFLGDLSVAGSYHLVPAVFDAAEPKVFWNHAISKKLISVKMADDVGEHDLEGMALPGRLAKLPE